MRCGVPCSGSGGLRGWGVPGEVRGLSDLSLIFDGLAQEALEAVALDAEEGVVPEVVEVEDLRDLGAGGVRLSQTSRR